MLLGYASSLVGTDTIRGEVGVVRVIVIITYQYRFRNSTPYLIDLLYRIEKVPLLSLSESLLIPYFSRDKINLEYQPPERKNHAIESSDLDMIHDM